MTVSHLADFLIFKTQADKKTWAKPEAFEAWVFLRFHYLAFSGFVSDGRRVMQWATRIWLQRISDVFSSSIFTIAMIREYLDFKKAAY
jgi:hypothetical protein